MPHGMRLANLTKRLLPLAALALLLVLATTLALACGTDPASTSAPNSSSAPAMNEEDKEPGELIIYSGREEELIGPIVEQFATATGIDVKVNYGSNAALVATIQEEGQNSPADIYYGSDPGSLGALESRLQALPDLPTVQGRPETCIPARQMGRHLRARSGRCIQHRDPY